MTEESEHAYLVRVRAQVMCRDEGTGGWVALGGGGLADVMVCRRVPAAEVERTVDSAHTYGNVVLTEYYIHGRRISDNLLVLDCTVKDDFQYHKVMPTFHHWVSDEKRFGLTFQTAADARAFDKGVRIAVNELYRMGGSWPTMYGFKGPKGHLESKEDDDESNIFECLNLPTDSRSSSENSTASRVRRPDEITQTPILSAITLPQHPLSESMGMQYDDKHSDSDGDRCPYVHLSAVHEYTYPVPLGPVCTSPDKTSPNVKPQLLIGDTGAIKKYTYSSPPPLPAKRPAHSYRTRVKCKHCQEWYCERSNRAGSCQYAPDCLRACVDCVTCIKCAQCVLYHCMADSEGDFSLRPCACAAPDTSCTRRWLCVTLLSLLVPCLWCYLPLRCIHRAARSARLVGGAHSPELF